MHHKPTSQDQALAEQRRVQRLLAIDAKRDELLQRAYAKNESIIQSHFERGWSREKLSRTWGGRKRSVRPAQRPRASDGGFEVSKPFLEAAKFTDAVIEPATIVTRVPGRLRFKAGTLQQEWTIKTEKGWIVDYQTEWRDVPHE